MPEEILADLKSKGVILLEFIYVDYTGIARGKTMFIDAVGNRLTDGMGYQDHPFSPIIVD